ncbi:MAG: hypothetical protein VB862_03415, partial [Pirellulaceae bacterium]
LVFLLTTSQQDDQQPVETLIQKSKHHPPPSVTPQNLRGTSVSHKDTGNPATSIAKIFSH